MDMCIDMCVNICMHMCRHVYRHVYRLDLINGLPALEELSRAPVRQRSSERDDEPPSSALGSRTISTRSVNELAIPAPLHP